MAYRDRYLEYLEAVPGKIGQCRETGGRPVIGYSSNYDAIAEWDVDSFNQLLSEFLKEEPSFTEGETIDNMEDFARIVSYFAIHGLGGEVDITSGEVIEELKKRFKIQYALGGTCAQGAAALGAMGMPVLVHVTDRSKEVLACMDYEGIESVKGENKVSLRECVTEEEPLIHLIMQYTKGDILRVGEKEYSLPLSNRLIIDYDPVYKFLPVQRDFLDYVENHAEDIYCYDISGFNGMVDLDVLKERLKELKKHYKIVKERNPGVRIYFESAHYISTKIRDYVYESLSEAMDIMGMNEEELVDLTVKKAHPVDKESLESVLAGLDYLLELYPVKGIVMHSKDYSLYYGDAMEDIDLEMGLTLGNLMSGTRARIGRYGTREECRESLKLGLSPTGIKFAEQLTAIELKHTAVLVPSRYMEKPRYTIGLGDTFVAGMQMCFVK